MIQDIKITFKKKFQMRGGSIYHMLRNDDKLHLLNLGRYIFSLAYPRVIKGWHEHTKQTQNYAVIDGMIKLKYYLIIEKTLRHINLFRKFI